MERSRSWFESRLSLAPLRSDGWTVIAPTVMDRSGEPGLRLFALDDAVSVSVQWLFA